MITPDELTRLVAFYVMCKRVASDPTKGHSYYRTFCREVVKRVRRTNA